VGTNFPERAEVIAREVAEESPALVALQEVALWQTGPLSDPTQLQPTYDFLATLLGELEERGARYEPVATNVNFGGALPISATTLASFTDRDVILARSDLPTSELKLSNPTSHTFLAKLPLAIGGVAIEVPRGWSSVDVKFRGRSYRFVNTHLEAFSAGRRAQQAGFLVSVGPASTTSQKVVLVGDLNSDPTNGSTTPPDPTPNNLAYNIIAGAGYVDASVAANGASAPDTSGFNEFVNDTDLSGIDSRIDHILSRPGTSAQDVKVTGNDFDNRTPGGLWPSDHLGIVGKLYP